MKFYTHEKHAEMGGNPFTDILAAEMDGSKSTNNPLC